ncbi:MAG TPA: FAD/NAD(P)-binding oxidoreductase [Gaiellaceae bacterium]|jgi:sulfide:quinone oxidoreductase
METGKPHPLRTVIVGGGVAGLETVLALRALAGDRLSIEVIAPDRDFTYRPEAVAEPFRVGDIARRSLRSLMDAAGASLREGTLAAVDTNRWVVRLEGGDEVAFDILVLALGARPVAVMPNALTFRGPQDGPAFKALLEEIVAGDVRSVAFAAPVGASWSLPLYELALLTGVYLTERGTMNVPLTIVTPEDRPLGLFGRAASDAVAELLELRGITVRTGTVPIGFEEGVLRVAPDDEITADRVVALPRLEGPRIPGVVHDRDGFIPTDDFGRVPSEEDVYAVGDSSNFPLKQGGIATQQADAAAEAIAARAGAPIDPTPFKPVLRGLLLTGMAPRYLRAEPGTVRSVVDAQPLWWPPAKIVGRYLAPFLASELGVAAEPPPQAAEAVPVEIELDPRDHKAWAAV